MQHRDPRLVDVCVDVEVFQEPLALVLDVHDGIARYQATLRKLQTMSPYSVLVTHGAGVQACAESVDGIDMEDMEIGYCCLTNLKRQGTSEAKEAWKMGMLAVDKHTAGLESMRTNFR